MQLQESIEAVKGAGLGVLVVTYDEPALQRAFERKAGITYPLVSDVEARTVRAWGVLNESYTPDDDAYGVAHPGVFVIDHKGHIVDRIFIESYMSRLESGALLSRALASLASFSSRSAVSGEATQRDQEED